MNPIVIIDDEAVICRIFSLALRRLGHEVVTFTDPAEALVWLQTTAPCVVICDYRMPGLTGLDVLRALPDDVPFILVSGDLATTESTPRRGATSYLAKPVRPEELLEAIAPFVAG